MFSIKNKQYLYAGLAGCVGLGIGGLLLWSVDGQVAPQAPETPIETRLTTAGERMNPQELWVERLEGENKLTQEKLSALEKLMIENIKSIGEEHEKVQKLEYELEGVRMQKDISHFPDVVETPDNLNAFEPHPQGSGISKIVLNLSGGWSGGVDASSVNIHGEKSPQGSKQSKKQNARSTIENTLPAGTFAKAILLGGVDASTSISASSDPRPVLLRITDRGTLPRKFKSDLCDCHVLASCYGDLSSERVYMRLEKLTCTERLTGEVFETQIAGYVSGEDGKAGVRGVVADRAGPVIRNSLLGGFLSGMGKFFESGQSQLPLGFFGSPASLSAQQMLSSGAAKGTSNALDKYAEFFIKRAEQLQPVLQVASGREVDIVFTQGTRFGETSVKQALTKIREKSRAQALQTLNNQNNLWLPDFQNASNSDSGDAL